MHSAGAKQAVEQGRRFAVLQLQVGTDGKACQEAWNAVQAAHPGLPALFVTADQGASLLPCRTCPRLHKADMQCCCLQAHRRRWCMLVCLQT